MASKGTVLYHMHPCYYLTIHAIKSSNVPKINMSQLRIDWIHIVWEYMLRCASFCIFYPVAIVNMNSVAMPPGEGDGSGTAAQLRLSTIPSTATLGTGITVDVSVVTVGFETAIGKILQ